MGMGVGFAAGGMANSLAQQMFAPLNPQPQQTPPPQPTVSRYAAKSSASAESDTFECPECKERNAKGAKFCNGCGKKLIAEKMKCENCGAEMPETARFCNDCGTRRS
jgi:predicted amidophosphoribosyltransferase